MKKHLMPGYVHSVALCGTLLLVPALSMAQEAPGQLPDPLEGHGYIKTPDLVTDISPVTSAESAESTGLCRARLSLFRMDAELILVAIGAHAYAAKVLLVPSREGDGADYEIRHRLSETPESGAQPFVAAFRIAVIGTKTASSLTVRSSSRIHRLEAQPLLIDHAEDTAESQNQGAIP